MKKQGFTLSEILLVLSVIGVVAALTIPTLIQKINDSHQKAAWKKAFSSISQASISVLSDKGGTFKYSFDTAGITDNKAAENLKNSFKVYLNAIKECNGTTTYGGNGGGASVDGCWHKANEWAYLYGLGQPAKATPGLILSNGSLVRFHIDKSDCSYTTDAGQEVTICGYIQTDVNGFKGPNITGKDIFSIYLTESFIYPSGSKGWSPPETTCIEGSTDPTNTGGGCAAKYLYQ